jgi:hypothetical protein
MTCRQNRNGKPERNKEKNLHIVCFHFVPCGAAIGGDFNRVGMIDDRLRYIRPFCHGEARKVYPKGRNEKSEPSTKRATRKGQSATYWEDAEINEQAPAKVNKITAKRLIQNSNPA